jgi:hypothetical protein
MSLTAEYLFTVIEKDGPFVIGSVDCGSDDPEEVEATCHGFMLAGSKAICTIPGSMVVQSGIAPSDMGSIQAGQWFLKLNNVSGWPDGIEPGATISISGCPLANKAKNHKSMSLFRSNLSKSGDENVSAWEKIEALASTMIQKNASMSERDARAQAIVKALHTPEGEALYDEYRSETLQEMGSGSVEKAMPATATLAEIAKSYEEAGLDSSAAYVRACRENEDLYEAYVSEQRRK